jgi:hypothetical protein
MVSNPLSAMQAAQGLREACQEFLIRQLPAEVHPDAAAAAGDLALLSRESETTQAISEDITGEEEHVNCSGAVRDCICSAFLVQLLALGSRGSIPLRRRSLMEHKVERY